MEYGERGVSGVEVVRGEGWGSGARGQRRRADDDVKLKASELHTAPSSTPLRKSQHESNN